MFARQMVLIGLLHVLNLQSFKQNMKDLITFKYNHWKQYHKSKNLKTSFLTYKISRVQKLSGALPPAPTPTPPPRALLSVQCTGDLRRSQTPPPFSQ